MPLSKKNCKEGKSRNSNGRCVKIDTCKEGKEKNSKGQCINKCKSNQMRNPKTNRCIKMRNSNIVKRSRTRKKIMGMSPGKFRGKIMVKKMHLKKHPSKTKSPSKDSIYGKFLF